VAIYSFIIKAFSVSEIIQSMIQISVNILNTSGKTESFRIFLYPHDLGSFNDKACEMRRFYVPDIPTKVLLSNDYNLKQTFLF